MNILAFKICWKFAHFRKFYTTTSPLSFQIPPWTVIKWVIWAILWLDKDLYNEKFNSIKLWLKLSSNVSDKKMFWMNYSDTKRWYWNIQVKMETILNPQYIIYVWDEWFNDYDKLKSYLENGFWEYTPYLGISEFLANVHYLGEKENLELCEWENVSIDSVVPQECFWKWENIEIQEWEMFEFEKVPYQMDNERNLLSLKEFLYNPKWLPIKLKKSKYYKFDEECIILC